MRNPFTVLKSAVSRFFSKSAPLPSAIEYKAPDAPKVPRMSLPSTPKPEPFYGYKASQAKRNARRKERAEIRAFVLALNRARG